jgi:hypothetical protein
MGCGGSCHIRGGGSYYIRWGGVFLQDFCQLGIGLDFDMVCDG